MYEQITVQLARGVPVAALPAEMLERHGFTDGDRALLVGTDAGILIVPYDANVERALQLGERGAKKFRRALRELRD